jgi:hypothetical protein
MAKYGLFLYYRATGGALTPDIPDQPTDPDKPYIKPPGLISITWDEEAFIYDVAKLMMPKIEGENPINFIDIIKFLQISYSEASDSALFHDAQKVERLYEVFMKTETATFEGLARFIKLHLKYDEVFTFLNIANMAKYGTFNVVELPPNVIDLSTFNSVIDYNFGSDDLSIVDTPAFFSPKLQVRSMTSIEDKIDFIFNLRDHYRMDSINFVEHPMFYKNNLKVLEQLIRVVDFHSYQTFTYPHKDTTYSSNNFLDTSAFSKKDSLSKNAASINDIAAFQKGHIDLTNGEIVWD